MGREGAFLPVLQLPPPTSFPFTVLGAESSTSCMLGKHCTTEPYSAPVTSCASPSLSALSRHLLLLPVTLWHSGQLLSSFLLPEIEMFSSKPSPCSPGREGTCPSPLPPALQVPGTVRSSTNTPPFLAWLIPALQPWPLLALLSPRWPSFLSWACAPWYPLPRVLCLFPYQLPD